MADLYNEPILYVTEHGNTYSYLRRSDNNKLPMFFPGQEKVKVNLEKGIDEVLFFPIDKDKFIPKENVFLTGYKYNIVSNKDGNKYTIIVEVRRIEYEITGPNNISISRIFEPLHVPRGLNITNNNTSKVGLQMASDMVLGIVSENNKWYSEHMNI